MKKFFKSAFKTSSLMLIWLAFLCAAVGAVIIEAHESLNEVRPKPIVEQPQVNENEIKFNEARERLVAEVGNYIKQVAPKSKLDALNLIDMCDKYNVDIRLAIAQGHIESAFGTAGTAARTNSVFNVGAYDGHSASQQRKNGFGFDHPDESVEPYLKLLTTRYLVNGKTEKDLLKNFVNHGGHRYASNPAYEVQLKSIWNRIDKNSDIDEAYEEYKQLKLKLES